MISIFHKEATRVEFHSSSHKATFCFIVNTLTNLQGNIITPNRDFPKVVFWKKRLFWTLTLKMTLVEGNYYRRTRLVNRDTCKTCHS